MKKLFAVILTLFILIFCGAAADAAPQISAHSAILIDAETGRVMFSKSSDERLAMASTTKIITAVTALESDGFDIDRTIEISENAAGVEGSSMYLQKGEKISMRNLLYGLMLSSGNDAAVAIAEAVSGDEAAFVELMNKKVGEIGAADTHLSNPNGLPSDEHYSTAHDMAKITAYALKNPIFAEIVATKTHRIDDSGAAYPRVIKNHNKLLSMYDGCIGVKTGFTKTAGRCLVSAARRDNMTLICVTLNAPDDWSDHQNLLNFGFENYKMTTVIGADIPLCRTDVIGSDGKSVAAVPTENIDYPITQTEKSSTELSIYPEISAPLKKDEKIGEVTVVITDISSGEEIFKRNVDLVADCDIECVSKPCSDEGLFQKIKSFFSIWFDILN